MSHYLAIDLGAESGRVIRGTLNRGKLTMKEVHRFPNGAIVANGTLRWDIIRIFREIRMGLAKGAKGFKIKGVACDSWGVDYVLTKEKGPLLSLPYTYRDERTTRTFTFAQKKVSPGQLFAATGIGSMSINTLYQLIDDVENRPELLKFSDQFLLIGDYITWLLSGQARAEETLISGSQCWNTKGSDWAWPLIKKFKIPTHLLPKLVKPGTPVGKLLPYLAKETGLKNTTVVATCAHDTAAAVAAVPALPGNDWAYLSSGTWSLLGVELAKPIINPSVQKANFTNEVGFGGTTRFLKCLVGLWILQECRREWSAKNKVSDYTQIAQLAQAAPALRSLIRPDDARFAKMGDMIEKVQSYCRETKQPVPRTVGEIARCILDSLALLYRVEIDALEKLSGRKINTLHVVGGGCRNQLLNQATANATGRTVVAGPVEATAAGNILVQAYALKEVKGLAEIRQIVRDSHTLESYMPQSPLIWAKSLKLFHKLPRS